MPEPTKNDGFAWNLENVDYPHVFIQWKGTDVCMDFYCECGEHCHFDGDFAYTVECPHCHAVWEMPHNVFPRKACAGTNDYWRNNPKLMDRDEDFEIEA